MPFTHFPLKHNPTSQHPHTHTHKSIPHTKIPHKKNNTLSPRHLYTTIRTEHRIILILSVYRAVIYNNNNHNNNNTEIFNASPNASPSQRSRRELQIVVSKSIELNLNALSSLYMRNMVTYSRCVLFEGCAMYIYRLANDLAL